MIVNHSKTPSRLRNYLGPWFFTTHSCYFLLPVCSHPTILWDEFRPSVGKELQRPSVNTSSVLDTRHLGVTYRYVLCCFSGFSWISSRPFIWSKTSYRSVEDKRKRSLMIHRKFMMFRRQWWATDIFAMNPLSETVKYF